MRTKMIFGGMLLIAAFVMAGPQNANADMNVLATIDEVGQTYSSSSIILTIPAASITKKFFVFNSTGQNQMLATALTAFSLGKQVMVRIADDPNADNTVKGIRIKND